MNLSLTALKLLVRIWIVTSRISGQLFSFRSLSLEGTQKWNGIYASSAASHSHTLKISLWFLPKFKEILRYCLQNSYIRLSSSFQVDNHVHQKEYLFSNCILKSPYYLVGCLPLPGWLIGTILLFSIPNVAFGWESSLVIHDTKDPPPSQTSSFLI